MFEDYKKKDSVVVVYTGEGKGKTSASLGLLLRAFGAGWTVSYVQFVKHWEVNEHKAIKKLQDIADGKIDFYKGGKGFYKAGELSAKDVSESEHKKSAQATFEYALDKVKDPEFKLVICDEINNAVHDGLLPKSSIQTLIDSRAEATSLCLTGRNFPEEFLDKTDIATNMTKLRHHFDKKYLANEGIDF